VKALLALLLALPLTAAAAEPQPFVGGSWTELRHAHAGRPTMVHFWGFTCGPCLTELPQWGQFASGLQDIDMVMVDTDPTVVAAADLAATLAKAGLSRVESWRFADAFTERLEYEIDPQWRGELPYTLLIGRDGTIQPILGAVDFAELRQWSDQQNRRAENAKSAISH
jgi:thiol-disulfide isomerase/thioredoxin